MNRRRQRFGQRSKLAPRLRGLPWAFVNKEVTAWGGLWLLQAFLMRLHVREMLAASPVPRLLSNRGYSPVLMVKSFLVAV